MAGPDGMAALFGSSPGARIRLGCRGRFPEQGSRRKHRAGSRHGFAKVVSSSDWRRSRGQGVARNRALRRQEIPCPHRGGKDRRRIADRRPRRANRPASGPHPAFRISRRIVAFEDLLTRRAGKSGSEGRRSGEFRRELWVDVAGVAKAFPREVAAGSNGSASTRRSGGFENTTSATARLASDLA